jgi:hypothetical protein
MEFHKTGAAYMKYFSAVVVLTGLSNIFEYLKFITDIFLTIRSEKTTGDLPLYIQ